MTLTADKRHSGMELVDLLLSDADETSGYRSNLPWTSTVPDTLSPEGGAVDDFLEALLAGSDTSSTPASPLWSPSTSDSGVAEDLPTDPGLSPSPASGSAFPAFDAQAFLQRPPLDNHLPPDGKVADVSIDIGWEADDLQDQFGIAYYLSTDQSSPLAPSQTVTVRDLLLSNLGQKSHRLQDSLQELQLNEDEKKLLTKEGVNLPSNLPLSKFEEKVLKKIRRKIRNKRSAQESRKKKREYVDSLEGRMTACSAHNLELQRKIQQLEETNNALLERLSRLQALLPNSSNKTTHKGTCLLPDSYSQLRHGEYTKSTAPSRSLQSTAEARDVPPVALPFLAVSRGLETLTEKLWLWKSLSTSSPHKDHRSQGDH